jgi:hypothetical protein
MKAMKLFRFDFGGAERARESAARTAASQEAWQ